MISKGNQVKFARFVLLAVSEKQKKDFNCFCSMYNKTIIRFGFRDIQNNQGLGNVISRSRLPRSTSIILDITKTSYNNCL